MNTGFDTKSHMYLYSCECGNTCLSHIALPAQILYFEEGSMVEVSPEEMENLGWKTEN